MAHYHQAISHIARLGYGAKTVVYVLLGCFVCASALSFARSDTPSKDEVFETLLRQPFGQVLLGGVAIGLACYMLWRWIQVALNTEDLDMSKAKDVTMRVFYAFSGLMYGVGAWAATKVLIGAQESSNKEGGQKVSEELMNYTWGQYLVGGVALAILIFALIQLKHAYKADFMKKFNRHHMKSIETTICQHVGRLGYLARGIVYILIAAFFFQAALQLDPSEAGGIKTAFKTVLEQKYGQWELAAIGVGIGLFGIFCGFETVYRTTPGNR